MQVDDVVLGLAAGVGIALSPDGNTALYVEWSLGTVIRVDTKSGAIQQVRSGLAFPQDVEVDWATGETFVSERNGQVKVIQGREPRSIDVGGAPHQMAFVEHGGRRLLYVVCYDSGELRCIDLGTNAVSTIATNLGHPVGLVVDKSTKHAYVTEQDFGTLSHVELANGNKTTVASGLTAPFFLAWNKNAKAVYCVQRDPLNSLVEIDVGNGAVTGVATGLAWRPSGVAPTVDDARIYICADQKLQVLSAAGVPPIKPGSPPFVVESVDFTNAHNRVFPLKNHYTNTMVTAPEYIAGTKNDPVAMLVGSTVHLRIVLRRRPAYAGGAYSLGATGSHGGVKRIDVTPNFHANGLSDPIDMTYLWPLPGTVGKPDVILNWYARQLPGPSVPTPMGPTWHHTFLLIAPPTEPWIGKPLWIAALERACGWADGAHTQDEAAGKVTAGYNGSGRVSYDTVSGASFYTFDSGGGFSTGVYLSQMIERLNGSLGLGEKVNCTDSAAMVSTFANAIGCDLWQSKMGYHFHLNPIIAIGYTTWAVPFNGGFSYHEVAWKGACDEQDAVFDGCLHVDGDADPTNSPHVALLPVNIKYGQCGAMDYRLRLCPPGSEGCGACQTQPGTQTRRTVG